jgi:hypothetical protein
VLELDPYKVGEALMMIGVTSCQLGHRTIRGTIDPYLMSKPREEWSPEHLFVMDLLMKPPADVIPREEVHAVIRARPPFNPDGDRGQRADKGRITCPECGRDVSVRSGGSIRRHHYVETEQAAICPASGTLGRTAPATISP